MCEIKALEELRGLRDEVTYQMVDNPNWICGRVEGIVDKIEAEIAERFMELPVDMDGVPIHVGDELETAQGSKVIVDYVGKREIRVYRDGEYYKVSQDEYACTCSHVKPRTLEDVLHDVWNEALDYAESNIWRNPDEVFAERADEIRDMFEEANR